MKKYLSLQEILDLNISELPTTRQAIDYYAKKQEWHFKLEEKQGRGRPKKLYALPDDLYELAKAKMLQKLADSAVLPSDVEKSLGVASSNQPTVYKGVTDPTLLADWQRNCGTARLAIVRYVLELSELMGKTKAVQKFANDSKDGKLTATLAETVRRANAKAGKDGNAKVSRATLFGWLKIADEAGEGESLVALLAPKSRDVAMPAWSAVLLKLWGQPTKPPLSEVMRQLDEVLGGVGVPTYAQARYFLVNHVGNVEVERGRMGSRELKNILPFVRRDTSMLYPTDGYTADGHTFDAEVSHPLSGKPFRPEITSIIDIASRKIVGFSVDLAESGLAVLSGISMAVCTHGVMAIFYVDNGSGYKNAMMSAEGVGLMDRLGATIMHSLPYNSQAKGIIERSHQTIWIRLAKKLPTFIGADMDTQAKQAVFKKTRKDIKTVGQSKVLLAWEDFIELCHKAVAEYNTQPHSALPRRVNKLTGRKGHMTPQEYWDEKVAEMQSQGRNLVTLSEREAIDLFRPRTEATVRRCEIHIFNHIYFSKDLTEYHNEKVQVGYDVHNPMQIWVYDLSGHLLTVAGFEANKVAYFPESVVEQAQQKRLQAQLKRNQNKGKDILETMSPSRVLEHIDSMRLPETEIAKAQARWNTVIEGEAVDMTHQVSHQFAPLPTSPQQGEGQKPLTIDADEEKFQRWLALDSRYQNGEVLDSNEFDFWELFQDTKLYRIKMQNYLEKGGNTTPRDVDDKVNNDGLPSEVIQDEGFFN